MQRCLGCMELFSEDFNVCPHCGRVVGETTDTPLFLTPGKTLAAGRYLVGKVLGYGGFGVTYLGWDEKENKKVAIKEYLPNNVATRTVDESSLTVFTGEKSEMFLTGMQRFLNEAKMLARFKDYPGVVSILDFFQENKTAYIVMDFIEGVTLKVFLKQNGKMDPDETVRIMTPVMETLEKIHQVGIVHRDISPDNLIIDGEKITLIDFGAARTSNVDDEKTLSIILKHGYAPEEQYRQNGVQGPWTDIYAICATMYRCITGKVPPNALERISSDSLVRPSDFGIDIDKNIEDAIIKGMSVNSSGRFGSVADLLKAIKTGNISGYAKKDDTTFSFYDIADRSNDSSEETAYTDQQEHSENEYENDDIVVEENDERSDEEPFGFENDNDNVSPESDGFYVDVPPEELEKNKKPLAMIIIIAAVAVLLALLICILALRKSSNKTTGADTTESPSYSDSEEDYSTSDEGETTEKETDTTKETDSDETTKKDTEQTKTEKLKTTSGKSGNTKTNDNDSKTSTVASTVRPISDYRRSNGVFRVDYEPNDSGDLRVTIPMDYYDELKNPEGIHSEITTHRINGDLHSKMSFDYHLKSGDAYWETSVDNYGEFVPCDGGPWDDCCAYEYLERDNRLYVYLVLPVSSDEEVESIKITIKEGTFSNSYTGEISDRIDSEMVF